MTKIIVILAAVICSGTLQVFGQDESLVQEIRDWQKGSPPPIRLLKFPDGKFTLPLLSCGVPTIGDSVDDYIRNIKDPDLLRAIIFDRTVQADSFRSAARQFIRLKGVDRLARLMARKGLPKPSLSMNSESAILTQLLRSPYIALKVAEVSSDDMELEKAQAMLMEMKLELESGMEWAALYRKHADLNPDPHDPDHIRTIIRYRYDGVVSPTGFDILRYSVSEYVPPLDHLHVLFSQKGGTHVVKALDRVYLYHVESFFEGASKH